MMAGRLRDSDVRGEVEDAFTAFDKDSNGAIGVEDLRAAAAEVGGGAHGPGLEATVNSTTRLTYSHLWCFVGPRAMQLGEDIATRDLEEMVAEADLESKGEITFDSFHKLMTSN